MPTTPAITKDLPLPVRVFNAAMEQQLSLSDYAQSLGISADSLRAIVTAQLNHVEPAILDRLADLYQQSLETLRDRVWITPPQESFAAWLKRNLEGISQRALRTRVQLDAKTLKRFLNAELLPDSDQAERIARALYIDRREVARVVTASMIHQAEAERLVDTTSTSAEQRLPALTVTAAPATVRSKRTRSQNATSNAEPAAKEGAAASEIPTTSPIGSIAHRDNSTAAATDSETLPAFNAPNQRITRKQRRSGPVSKHGAADLAPPVIIPREVEVPVSEAALERDPASDIAPTATGATVAVAQPTGLAMKTDAALPRTPPSEVNGSAFSTSRVTAAPPTAAIPPSTMLRPAPLTTSTTIALAPAPATVPSVVTADATTLQLTADEVRLIRRWRQLHPHGRRATLHYIGSLLVED